MKGLSDIIKDNNAEVRRRRRIKEGQLMLPHVTKMTLDILRAAQDDQFLLAETIAKELAEDLRAHSYKGDRA